MGRTRRGAHAASPFGEQCPPLPQANNTLNKTPDRWGAHAGPRPPRHAPPTRLSSTQALTLYIEEVSGALDTVEPTPRGKVLVDLAPRNLLPPLRRQVRHNRLQRTRLLPRATPALVVRLTHALGIACDAHHRRCGARQRVAPASCPARVLPRASHIPLQVPNVQFKAVLTHPPL